jgi:hypothetical protein
VNLAASNGILHFIPRYDFASLLSQLVFEKYLFFSLCITSEIVNEEMSLSEVNKINEIILCEAQTYPGFKQQGWNLLQAGGGRKRRKKKTLKSMKKKLDVSCT